MVKYTQRPVPEHTPRELSEERLLINRLFGRIESDSVFLRGTQMAAVSREEFVQAVAHHYLAVLFGIENAADSYPGHLVIDTGTRDRTGAVICAVVRTGSSRRFERFGNAGTIGAAAMTRIVVSNLSDQWKTFTSLRRRIQPLLIRTLKDCHEDLLPGTGTNGISDLLDQYTQVQQQITDTLALLPDDIRSSLHTAEDVRKWLENPPAPYANAACISLPHSGRLAAEEILAPGREIEEEWESLLFSAVPADPRAHAIASDGPLTPAAAAGRLLRAGRTREAERYLLAGLWYDRSECLPMLLEHYRNLQDSDGYIAVCERFPGEITPAHADILYHLYCDKEEYEKARQLGRRFVWMQFLPEYTSALHDRDTKVCPVPEQKLWRRLRDEGESVLRHLLARLRNGMRTGAIAVLFSTYRRLLSRERDERRIGIYACLSEDVPDLAQVISCGLGDALDMLHDPGSDLREIASARAYDPDHSRNHEVWDSLLQIEHFLNNPFLAAVMRGEGQMIRQFLQSGAAGALPDAADYLRKAEYPTGSSTADIAERVWLFCGLYQDAAETIARFDPIGAGSVLLAVLQKKHDRAGMLALLRENPPLRRQNNALWLRLLYENGDYEAYLAGDEAENPFNDAQQIPRIRRAVAALYTGRADSAMLDRTDPLLAQEDSQIIGEYITALQKSGDNARLVSLTAAHGDSWLCRFSGAECARLFAQPDALLRQVLETAGTPALRIYLSSRLGMPLPQKTEEFYREKLTSLESGGDIEQDSDVRTLNLLENLFPDRTQEFRPLGLAAQLHRILKRLPDSKACADAAAGYLMQEQPDETGVCEAIGILQESNAFYEPVLVRCLIRLSERTHTEDLLLAPLVHGEDTRRNAPHDFYVSLFELLAARVMSRPLSDEEKALCLRKAAAEPLAACCLFFHALYSDDQMLSDAALGLLADTSAAVLEAYNLLELTEQQTAGRWPEGTPETNTRFFLTIRSVSLSDAMDCMHLWRALYLPEAGDVCRLCAEPVSVPAWNAVLRLAAQQHDPVLTGKLMYLRARHLPNFWNACADYCAANACGISVPEVLLEWVRQGQTAECIGWISSRQDGLAPWNTDPVMPELTDLLCRCDTASDEPLLQALVSVAGLSGREDFVRKLIRGQQHSLTQLHPDCGTALLCYALLGGHMLAAHLLATQMAEFSGARFIRYVREIAACQPVALRKRMEDPAQQVLALLMLPNGREPDAARLSGMILLAMEKPEAYSAALTILHERCGVDNTAVWEMQLALCTAPIPGRGRILTEAVCGLLRTKSHLRSVPELGTALALLTAGEPEVSAGTLLRELAGSSVTACAHVNAVQAQAAALLAADPACRGVWEALLTGGALPDTCEIRTLTDCLALLPDTPQTACCLTQSLLHMLRTLPDAECDSLLTRLRAELCRNSAEIRAIRLCLRLRRTGWLSGAMPSELLDLPLTDAALFPTLNSHITDQYHADAGALLLLACCSPAPKAQTRLTEAAEHAGSDVQAYEYLRAQTAAVEADAALVARTRIAGLFSGILTPPAEPAEAVGMLLYLQSTPRAGELLRLIACFPEPLHSFLEMLRRCFLNKSPEDLIRIVREQNNPEYRLCMIEALRYTGMNVSGLTELHHEAVEQMAPERIVLLPAWENAIRTASGMHPARMIQRDPSEFSGGIQLIELPAFAQMTAPEDAGEDKLMQMRMAYRQMRLSAGTAEREAQSREILRYTLALARPAADQYAALLQYTVDRCQMLTDQGDTAGCHQVLRELMQTDMPPSASPAEALTRLRALLCDALPGMLLEFPDVAALTADYTANRLLYQRLCNMLSDPMEQGCIREICRILDTLEDPLAAYTEDPAGGRTALLRVLADASARVERLGDEWGGLRSGLASRIRRTRRSIELQPELTITLFGTDEVHPGRGVLSGQLTNKGSEPAESVVLRAVFEAIRSDGTHMAAPAAPVYTLGLMEPEETAPFEIPYGLPAGCTGLSWTITAECSMRGEPMQTVSDSGTVRIGTPPPLERCFQPFNTESAVFTIDPETREPQNPAFFGRETEKGMLRALVSGERFTDYRSAIVYGFRRIGKTSLLNYLRAYIGANRPDLLCVSVDVQSVNGDAQNSGFSEQVVQDVFIKPVLEALPEDDAKNALKQQWELAPDQVREPRELLRFYRSVLAATGRGVYLLIDEFDRIFSAGAGSKALLQVLSSMLDDPDCREAVHFVICGSKWLLYYEATGDFLDQLSQRFGDNRIEVGALTRQDTADLLHSVTKLIPEILLPEETVSRIWHYTGGIAWYTMLYANAAIRRAQDNSRRTVTPSDVDAVSDDILTERNCKQFFEGCPRGSTELQLLTAMTGQANRRGKEIPADMLLRMLDCTPEEGQRALRMLTVLGLIVQSPDGMCRFRLEIIRLYFRGLRMGDRYGYLPEQETRLLKFRK